jgi:hypothetical protein
MVAKLQLINTIQYAALLLCLVSNNKVSNENLSLKQLKSDIYNDCGINQGTSDRTITDALSHFRERFSFDTLLLFTKHKASAAY